MVTNTSNNNTRSTNVLVLLSGGIDSSACVGYYLSHECNVAALFVDYGQANAQKEFAAASAVSDYYKIQLEPLRCSGHTFAEGYIRARNSLLLSLGLMSFSYSSGIIALGIHAGTPYQDCSPEFKHAMQTIYDVYEEGRVRVDAPFLHWTKSDIWDYAKLQNVPLHLTYSNNLDSLRPVADYLRTH